ncbi:Putative histone acetylase [Komagataella phaffii CBS 7435]|uniref:Histone acetylase, sequence-specific activator of histone genes n=2 Tax=Komagataella phaffii TaxID=460519 RepID=C4R2R1_KOMPG|nr:uncharacterized protein PAS_chr2-2_0140 [Komagataella phaffii GS115]AOA61926.1 GQ67_01205T0 [Komagataella phaffii]CAH2447659.1 Putative histone acetylase [Komagataella phaffii CBS 7435]AOA67394.1 GQ68_00184T0 [Komagataella phaffii GS115]CAY69785.1 Putative histone acetylase, sequence-specific activator of histone genes [Komagataella phaffii GS115]CCA37844.1 Putative histone acetylase [Komagataella phaffii CBS 7435]
MSSTLDPELITPSITVYPFQSSAQVPKRLLQQIHHLLNYEVEQGDTYPQKEPLDDQQFFNYYAPNFVAVALRGDFHDASIESLKTIEDFSKIFLGSFYIKPNYVGRCSHICNGGFLVHPSARGEGLGSKMGKVYLKWAPKLGYSYSIFNLVFESNTASCRIWDKLGFNKIGVIPRAANLKGHSKNVNAIIYGRCLLCEGECTCDTDLS